MVDAVSSPRAQLVELLWQLKQSFDQESDNNLRFVHFNTLLNDSEYREEIIQRALNSKNRKVRALGEQLEKANRDGALLHRRAERSSATATQKIVANPDILETLHPSPNAARKNGTLGNAGIKKYSKAFFASLIAASLAVMGYFTYYPIANLLSGEQVVKGSLFGNQVWDAGSTWILDGIVYVEAGATLTIEPGTRVEGRPGSALVVTREGQIYSRGQQDAPIVFTSNQAEGTRTAGDWGGVVMLGDAPVNVANAQIEGVPAGDSRGAFGGSDSQSSCGVMEYTRVEFAGFEVYANNELNGLTLGGCGSGTIIRHVQVHRALDDGIEVFGGTVDLKHIIITGAGDDSLDWDMGWQGRVQFLIVQQHANLGDNGFEGDNNKKAPTAGPISQPQMYNVSLVSPRSHEKFHRAMTLKAGTAGQFNNMIVQGFSGEAIDVKGGETVYQIEQGNLTFHSVMFHRIGSRGLTFFSQEHLDNDDDNGFQEWEYFQNTAQNVQFATDPLLPQSATSIGNPDFTPASRSPARNRAAPIPQGEFWDEAANYLGAVRPGSLSNWTHHWPDYPLH